MFANIDALCRWAANNCLSFQNIPSVYATSAVRVSGWLSGQKEIFGYNQLWARATYSGYARALRNVAKQCYGVDITGQSGIQADHVINRRRLHEHPDAWVAIFPVHKSANCPFGAIEKRLRAVPKGDLVAFLPPLVALKLFCGVLPKTRDELLCAMRDVRGQFDQHVSWVRDYCDQAHAEALNYVL
ncbi:hypothetical protein [Bradyrhizobium sp. ORS 285]|uniref:hypothetical protein n=1 Tax=Bradyrhizobium sp. ORS 285 TaxID=115808 RepID=UPI0011128A46|nr:hypothetical protein [Bradyrhizobium sp. ORS 285]